MDKTYTAKTKAGRAWINAILDATTRVYRVDIDNLTDKRTSTEFSLELLRRFVEIDGRKAVIYDTGGNHFVYFSGSQGRFVTKYEITAYAFDVTDLLEVK